MLTFFNQKFRSVLLIMIFAVSGTLFFNLSLAKAGGFDDITIGGSNIVLTKINTNLYAFSHDFDLSIGSNVEKVEVLSASADNGLSYSFNSSANIYYGDGDCDTNDPSDLYPNNYASIWTYYSGADIKNDVVDGTNTISGTLYNCTGGPYSVSNIVIRVYYYDPACTLSSSSVMSGESPVISWTTQYVDNNADISRIGFVTPLESGSIVDPNPITTDTTYTMIATNSSGDVATCSVSVDVIECKAGLVPCGRRCDVLSTTSYDESEPCTLCHLILMLQLIIEFIVKLSAIVAVFAIALSGLLYIFSAGNQGRIESAKTGIKYALIGFIIILIAWILVDSLFVMLGYIDPLSGEWYVVNC